MVDTAVNMGGLVVRHGLLDETEDADRTAALAAPSDAHGSLWWHRNFADADEALVRAQAEVVGTAVMQELLHNEEMRDAVEVVGKFQDGFFPEYVSYPERSRLVDPDRVSGVECGEPAGGGARVGMARERGRHAVPLSRRLDHR